MVVHDSTLMLRIEQQYRWLGHFTIAEILNWWAMPTLLLEKIVPRQAGHLRYG
ncbi:MAG: hypothetical protein ACPGVO_20370 [Spirulinaceae cyanobacterium]